MYILNERFEIKDNIKVLKLNENLFKAWYYTININDFIIFIDHKIDNYTIFAIEDYNGNIQYYNTGDILLFDKNSYIKISKELFNLLFKKKWFIL